MPDVMFAQHMDAFVAGGCTDPACTHPHASEGFFVVSRCHPRGVAIGLHGDVGTLPCSAVLHLQCWQCRQDIAFIAVGGPTPLGEECAHDGPTQTTAADAEYRDGQLTISCRRCHTMKLRFAVAVLPDTTAA